MRLLGSNSVERRLQDHAYLIEHGSLKKADIPDDYAWLVDQLAEIN